LKCFCFEKHIGGQLFTVSEKFGLAKKPTEIAFLSATNNKIFFWHGNRCRIYYL